LIYEAKLIFRITFLKREKWFLISEIVFHSSSINQINFDVFDFLLNEIDGTVFVTCVKMI